MGYADTQGVTLDLISRGMALRKPYRVLLRVSRRAPNTSTTPLYKQIHLVPREGEGGASSTTPTKVLRCFGLRQAAESRLLHPAADGPSDGIGRGDHSIARLGRGRGGPLISLGMDQPV
jgi:hypothetical protein